MSKPAKNDTERRAVSKYDAWAMHPPKDDAWAVCILKYDTRSPCIPKYDTRPPGAESYPETKRKEIYSVMRKIAAAIPDAVVSGENQLLFLQDTDAVVEAINQLWRVGVTWETNFANQSASTDTAAQLQILRAVRVAQNM